MSQRTDELPIYIPTHGRSTVRTLEQFTPALRSRAVLVVGPNSQRLATIPNDVASWVTSKQGRGAVHVKQAILDKSRRDGHAVCIMLDDDLQFQSAYFAHDGIKRFLKADPEQVESAIALLAHTAVVEGTGFTSFSSSFFNRTIEPWCTAKRPAHTLFINTRATKGVANFRDIPTMSDMKFCLECWTNGLGSLSYMSMAAVDMSKREGGETGACGGLEGRAARFREARAYLMKRWPQYVKERDASQNKAHMTNIGEPVDVTIFASRAYKDAINAHKKTRPVSC